MKFTELNLKPEILKALQRLKYSDLTPIQEETFPHIMAGRDIIALAETGSGKTSACGIPVVQTTDASNNAIQTLVVVPTRELALQYVSAISDVAKYTDIAPFAVYGGFSIDTQKAKLAHGVHILIATPGRLIDLLYNSTLSLSQVRSLILDEADEMLNMGFIGDVELIMSCLIHEHQTMLFSATMSQGIKKLARKYLRDPVLLELNAEQIAPQSLLHHFKQFSGHKKFSTLIEYMKEVKPAQSIIFCNSRRNCDKLFDHLKGEMDSVEMIHGGLDQSKRTSLFNRFKKMQIKVIIATDIASRGLDFSHVTHVINYDFPDGALAYTHRTGRTARMGRKGTAVTFFSSHDLRDLKTVIKSNNVRPVWLGKEPDLNRITGSGGGGRQYGRGGGKRKNFRESGRGKHKRSGKK